eukprot:jgi/Astpho2/2423/e_gw1.00044.113.1_t
MPASKHSQLVNDVFQCLKVDSDNKKFDKVSRIEAHSDMYEMDLTLDIHSDLCPMAEDDKFRLLLSRTLNVDGSDGASYFDKDLATNATSHTLLDAYEYVMHGKIFKTQDAKVHGQMKLDVFISFGGLLMKLTGAAKELELLQPDNDVFLLMRKVRD